MKLTRLAQLPAHAVRAIVAGIVFWISITAIAAVALWHARSQALAYATQSATATVALMEQHTASTFQAVSAVLDQSAAQLASRAMRPDDPLMREQLRAHLRDMPYVRAIFVIDENGTIIHDTDYPTTPHVSLADRPYFRLLRDNPAIESSIGAPLQSRSGTGWFVPVVRRVSDNGRLKGVIVAAIQLRYFSDLYLRMGLAPGQHIALFHRDATLLAQYPTDDAVVGKTYAEYPLFKTHLPLERRGVYQTSGPPVPYERIFSYAALDTQPLVVALGHDTAYVLASWWRGVWIIGAALSLLLVAVCAVVAQYAIHESHRQRMRLRIQQGEKLEALGQLTGGIAHDFGNLLGIVNNNIELLDRLIAEKNEKTSRALASAKRAVASATNLTRDLMAFARKRELKVVTVEISDALARIEPMLRHAAGRDVQLRVSAPAGIFCQLDYNQLEVALINLVVNARDAMESHGTIEVRASELKAGASGAVEVSVADTGPGMTDEVRARALEPFFTTKGENGTGLGLSQVYGFVKQVGGDLSIDSGPGKGTSVRLRFPQVSE